ncbi:MAG: hypothetical protein LAO31_06555 [Acidobacteriia bacterium]|nr:hypothetical protein [Terriglobia bacterium]
MSDHCFSDHEHELPDALSSEVASNAQDTNDLIFLLGNDKSVRRVQASRVLHL